MCVIVRLQYIFAFEESQKYKEGMVILERALVVDFDKTSHAASHARRASSLSSGSAGAMALDGSSTGSEYGAGGSPPGMYGGRMTLFAADDSGTEDDEC